MKTVINNFKDVVLLSNVSITKRKEYSRSYGGVEVVSYPLGILHTEGRTRKLTVFSEANIYVRTFNLGTKLLLSYTGEEVSERTFLMRAKKLKALDNIEQQKRNAEFERWREDSRRLAEATAKAFTPEVAQRFRNKWAEINPKFPNYISHKQANSFVWKKQNYLNLEKVSIVELRGLVKEAINQPDNN